MTSNDDPVGVVMESSSRPPDYVVGFLFFGPPDDVSVVLISKKRPAWQAGKLNAVGGHIEQGETPYRAMQREWQEETGVDLQIQWTDYVHWNAANGGAVYGFFAYVQDFDWRKLVSGDETLHIARVRGLHLGEDQASPPLYNVPWLTHMAWSAHVTGAYYDLTERMKPGFFRR